MRPLRHTLSIVLLLLLTALAFGVSGAAEAVRAQTWSQRAAGKPSQAVALPLYFTAAGDGDGGTDAPARLLPSATAARTYDDLVTLYRRTHSLDAAHPLPADLLLAGNARIPQQIRPELAVAQAASIAASRGLPFDAVLALISWCTEVPLHSRLGVPTVNLRLLNLALDDLSTR